MDFEPRAFMIVLPKGFTSLQKAVVLRGYLWPKKSMLPLFYRLGGCFARKEPS